MVFPPCHRAARSSAGAMVAPGSWAKAAATMSTRRPRLRCGMAPFLFRKRGAPFFLVWYRALCTQLIVEASEVGGPSCCLLTLNPKP